MMAASMLLLVGPLEFAQKSYLSNAASSKIGKIDYLDAKHRGCGSSARCTGHSKGEALRVARLDRIRLG